MECLILCTCLAALVCCLTVCVGAAVAVWRILAPGRRSAVENDREETPAETPEMRSQRLFEQGFMNLMNYDGSPRRKEREIL